MREEKRFLTQEYVVRLKASPFFILVDYCGLNVPQFAELRKRLQQAGAEVHVVKNSVFRLAVREAELGELKEALVGQLAAVTGQREIAAAAKVLRNFEVEFKRPKVKFGYLGNERLEKQDIVALADLPPLEVLRAQLLGVLQGPAARLVQLLNAPAAQLVGVLQARAEQATQGQ
jgi:large subunit ribosomal protein L10